MKIVAVDDESLSLEWLVKNIEKVCENANIEAFSDPYSVLDYARNNICDIAFLDIEMSGIDGIQLADKLKKTNSGINIIFITGHPEYSVEAFSIHASGYLIKPVTEYKVRNEILNLRYPVVKEKKLKVKCFGNFEVFSDNVPLKFARSKTKEFFAYMVDRQGAVLNTNQLCAVLWENEADSESVKSQFRVLVADLKTALKRVNAEEVFITARNSFSINTELIDCDYYRYIKGQNIKFENEYMVQYSWAELKNAELAIK